MGTDHGRVAVVRVRCEMEKLIEDLEEMQNGFLQMARDNTKPEMDPVAYKAFLISETSRKAAEALRRNIPQEMETEGGGSTWFLVCPECHGAIDAKDKYCRYCGQAVK